MIEEKFVVDSSGQLKSYWTYKSEGPIVFSTDELESDQKYYALLGMENFRITIHSNGRQIIDSGDTLNIEKIFLKERLIFVERDSVLKKSGRRWIYEYQ